MGAKALDRSDPRLWNFIDKSKGPNACWPWTGGRKGVEGSDYGQVRRGGKLLLAHRLVWEYVNGPIPIGMGVLHKCDNPPCCNPAHLFLGTQADNMMDMARKGRGLGKGQGVKGDDHYLRREPERAIRGEDRTQAKLTNAAVLEIRARWPAEKQKTLAAEFGVSQMTISRVVRRKRWTHL